MCDVLHTMFEEDNTPTFEQHAEIKSRLREAIYRNLYDEEYGWAFKGAADASMSLPEVDERGEQRALPAPRQRYARVASAGLTASAVNPETGTMDLPEGTKRADPAKRLPRVQSASSMEDLSGVLGQPLG